MTSALPPASIIAHFEQPRRVMSMKAAARMHRLPLDALAPGREAAARPARRAG